MSILNTELNSNLNDALTSYEILKDTMLPEKSTTSTVTVSDINQYKFIMVGIVPKGLTFNNYTTIIPVSMFKTYPLSASRTFSGYSGSSTVKATYVDDTTITFAITQNNTYWGSDHRAILVLIK